MPTPIVFHDRMQTEIGFFTLKIVFNDRASAQTGLKIVEQHCEQYQREQDGNVVFSSGQVDKMFAFDINKNSGELPFSYDGDKAVTITACESEADLHFDEFYTLLDEIESSETSIDHVDVLDGVCVEDMVRITLQDAEISRLPSGFHFAGQDKNTGYVSLIHASPGFSSDIDQINLSNGDLKFFFPEARLVSIEPLQNHLRAQRAAAFQPSPLEPV